MGLDEIFRLHEHAAGAAGGVVDVALVGGEHLDEEAHDEGRGVGLTNPPAFILRAAFGSLSHSARMAAILTLGACELGEEVLIRAFVLTLRAALPGRLCRPFPIRRVHDVTEFVRREPKLGFETDSGGRLVFGGGRFGSGRHELNSGRGAALH